MSAQVDYCGPWPQVMSCVLSYYTDDDVLLDSYLTLLVDVFIK